MQLLLMCTYKSIFIILIRYSCLISTTYFSSSICFICWTILTNIFTSNSNHINWYVHVNCNCMCGTHLHRKTTILFRYKTKQQKTRELIQTHLSLQLHPSVDPCMLCAPFAPSSLGCAPSACSSITVHHQPFNKITYQYSLSSNNFTALYQLNIFYYVLIHQFNRTSIIYKIKQRKVHVASKLIHIKWVI